jgi:hypothetical protein
VKIHRVDEEAPLEIAECGVPDQAADQYFEWLAPVERGSEEAAEGNVRAGKLKDVTPADQTGAGIHLPDWYSSGPRRPNERSDAGADDQAGNQAALLERPEHTDVGQSL